MIMMFMFTVVQQQQKKSSFGLVPSRHPTPDKIKAFILTGLHHRSLNKRRTILLTVVRLLFSRFFSDPSSPFTSFALKISRTATQLDQIYTFPL
jgi:hypothetical protein